MSRRTVDLNLWTPFETVGKSKEFTERIDAENEELNIIWENSETAFNSSFIFYASESDLKRWENLLFLSSEGTLEERRKRVYLKWNKQVIWTERTLQEYMNDWLGAGNYSFELKYNEYEFVLEIYINQKNIDLNTVFNRVRRIIPANLALSVRPTISSKLYIGAYSMIGEVISIVPLRPQDIEINFNSYLGGSVYMDYEIITVGDIENLK